MDGVGLLVSRDVGVGDHDGFEVESTIGDVDDRIDGVVADLRQGRCCTAEKFTWRERFGLRHNQLGEFTDELILEVLNGCDELNRSKECQSRRRWKLLTYI